MNVCFLRLGRICHECRPCIQKEGRITLIMAATERGSFLWMMFAITQVFLSIKLIGEVEGWISTLFGGGAAAAFMLALVIFRQEQRELILNPLKMSREVHDDAIKGQGQGVGVGVGLWIVSLIVLLFI